MGARILSLAAASLLIWLAPALASAQGLVAGRVRATDTTPLAGAKVLGESMQSGRVTEGRTDNAGRFAFIGLTRGPWVFTVEKYGYEPSQGLARVTRTGRTNLEFVLEVNPFAPPIPTTGVLAGIPAGEIQEDLSAAHSLFDQGDYDDAIKAYEVILERIPKLTGLHLQIGNAYLEKNDYERALEAYAAVPADTPAGSEAASAIGAIEAASAGR